MRHFSVVCSRSGVAIPLPVYRSRFLEIKEQNLFKALANFWWISGKSGCTNFPCTNSWAGVGFQTASSKMDITVCLISLPVRWTKHGLSRLVEIDLISFLGRLHFSLCVSSSFILLFSLMKHSYMSPYIFLLEHLSFLLTLSASYRMRTSTFMLCCML